MSTDPYVLVEQANALLGALYTHHEPRVWRLRDRAADIPEEDPACLWTRAQRRYLRRIAALPAPASRPSWWTATDEEQRGDGWRCRTCVLWRSLDGRSGYCGMPETPATVNCGAVDAWDLCEQWTPHESMATRQMELSL